MARDAARLEAVVAPACASLGVDLFDLEWRQGVVRVTVDRPGATLDLDAIAEVSRAISDALDADDASAPTEPYELEVSTPGVERRLRLPRHFAAAIGEQIAVRTKPGSAGERRYEGRLDAADEARFVVVDERGTPHEIGYDALDRAHTVFDWRAALKARAEAEERDERSDTRRRATTS